MFKKSEAPSESSMLPFRQLFQQVFQTRKGFSLREQMKTKNFYIIILFIAATSISIWLLSNPSPNFHTIVTQTHRQIKNIKSIPENIRNSNTVDLKVDANLLENLGFMDSNTIVISNDAKGQVNLPIIASSIVPGELKSTLMFLHSVRKFHPSRMLLIYDLGLGSSESTQLKKHCNKTRSCMIKKFDYDKYPSHVRSLEIFSYRPLCIQETLREYGAVIWAEPSEHFISGKLSRVLQQAQTIGISAWTIMDSVSALTHPKMFDYFNTKQDNYFFLHAAKASHIVIYNSEKIHKQLMLPWVKCALSEECISPTGAQNSGCKYERKPLFKYSGCHKYDMAALNVILGIIFNFETSMYSAKDEIFGLFLKDTDGRYNWNSTNYVTKTRLIDIR